MKDALQIKKILVKRMFNFSDGLIDLNKNKI